MTIIFAKTNFGAGLIK